MEISYRNAEENGEYVEALSHSVISEPLIKIFLLSDGSNIMAEEIDREIGVKKRKGKKKKKKKHRLIFEIEAQTILRCRSAKHRIKKERK